MSRRLVGRLLLLVGIGILLLSVFADAIGLGAQPGVFGWKQMIGAGAGILLGLIGFLSTRSRRPGQGN